ncbi:ABC transporter substrate-binding protein [Micromonospora sp. NBC_01412]|uniref:ABC transporter substrate-binding protein n=1 Tax=Micromonospora sp. NBC_01412 TaxID=2903590 RepID=UPI003247DB62
MLLRRNKLIALFCGVALTASACTGGGSNKPSGSSEIDRDAVLRVAWALPMPTLDPMLLTSVASQGNLSPVYDRLIQVDGKDKLLPMLATSWQYSGGGEYLELKLRSDVKFHDGTTFDAAAVKANIERGKTHPKSTVKGALKSITSVEVIDPTTARVHLVKGQGAELPSLFSSNAGMMISPKALADPSRDLTNNPGDAGSGPYVITAFVPQEKITMKRAPSYWDPKVGQLAGLEVSRVANNTTRLNGVSAGELDITGVSAPNDLTRAADLAGRGTFNIDKVQFRNVMSLFLDAKKGNLADLKVRQAIAHAIDPEKIAALFSGTCTPYRQFYPEDSWPALKGYQYPYKPDLAKAKQLISEAGGAKFELTFSAQTNTEQPANVIQAALKDAGADVKLVPVPNSEHDARYQAGDFDSMVSNGFNPKIDPAETMATYFLGSYRIAADPAAVKPLADQAANPTLPEAERAKIYQQIWEKVLQEAWFIPICRQTHAIISSPKVINAEGLPWANLGYMDLRSVAMVK